MHQAVILVSRFVGEHCLGTSFAGGARGRVELVVAVHLSGRQSCVSQRRELLSR